MFKHEATEVAGIGGTLLDMIKDGGDLVKQSLLWLSNCMLAGQFPDVCRWA